MRKIYLQKLERENKAPAVRFKSPTYKNNEKLKEKINFNEPFFRKEVRNDQLRAGYNQLLD